MPAITAASTALALGRNKNLKPSLFANWAIFKLPLTGLRVPSKESSPIKILSPVLNALICLVARR